MNRKATVIILTTVVAVLATLLLTGCEKSNALKTLQTKPEIHIPASIDTSAMDEEFYKRMWEFEALHPSSPSDK